MSFLTVTTDENGTIEIDFGVYYSMNVISFKKAYYSKNYIVKSHLMDDHILVWGSDVRTFTIVDPDGDQSKGLIVESFNGITPENLDHLFSMIKVIL